MVASVWKVITWFIARKREFRRRARHVKIMLATLKPTRVPSPPNVQKISFFFSSDTWFLCVALHVLELTLQFRLARVK